MKQYYGQSADNDVWLFCSAELFLTCFYNFILQFPETLFKSNNISHTHTIHNHALTTNLQEITIRLNTTNSHTYFSGSGVSKPTRFLSSLFADFVLLRFVLNPLRIKKF